MTSFRIGIREIGPAAPCLVIAEVAQAHDGSLGFAHAFIDLAKSVGADAIKFQTHIAAAETTPLEQFRVNFSYEDASRYDYWKRMEFTAEQWAGLKRHADEAGLIFLTSVFSIEALELMRGIGVPAWKVASGEVTNAPLLEAMAEDGRPILLSSGMSTMEEIGHAYSRVSAAGSPGAIFQCTSRYPTAPEDTGLNVIDELRARFGCPVGLSDHSGSVFPALAAMARGADIVEVHLAFHQLQFGPDTSASLTPERFRLLCEGRDAFHRMRLHPVDKDRIAAEMATMRTLFTKSVALREDRPRLHVLTAADLTTKKPGTGIPAERLPDYIGRRLKRDVSALSLLSEDDVD